MHLDIDQIEKSFEQLSPKLDELTLTFYTDLFTKHPEIKPLFGSVDLLRQRRKLAAMLTLIVTNLRRMDVLVPALRSLGERHIAYGATNENYGWTEDSLLLALERVAGEDWTEEVGRAWSSAIWLVTAEMRAGASFAVDAPVRSEPKSEDLDVLMEIASNPSLSFQRNSLFSSYVEKKKTDHEMDLARSVQQSLIPAELPDVKGYRFSASYEPATQVGGDYYDWVMPDDDRVCFVFGDVSGKGVSGALIMCRLAGAARALLSSESDASRVLAQINAHLCDRMPGGRFVTLAFLTLDLAAHRFTFANAGHLPPLHRRGDGEAAFLEHETSGLPVGIDKNAKYEAIEGPIAPGESIVLYTDGVNEALDPHGKQYGMERLQACAAAVGDAAQVGPALLHDVRRFASGRPQSDDLTILTISREMAHD